MRERSRGGDVQRNKTGWAHTDTGTYLKSAGGLAGDSNVLCTHLYFLKFL